jgi:hypothetical protein
VHKQALQDTDYSIIVLDKFIQATRDSGYKAAWCRLQANVRRC